jgi:hypothetical protein
MDALGHELRKGRQMSSLDPRVNEVKGRSIEANDQGAMFLHGEGLLQMEKGEIGPKDSKSKEK